MGQIANGFEQLGYSKVSELDIVFVHHQDILHFDVSVNDLLGVDVLHC